MSIVKYAALTAAVLLTACAPVPTTVIEKPVVVERRVTVAIPPDLLQRCVGKPQALSASTNGDLLVSWQSWQSYASCLESRLSGIADLQPK